VILYDIQTARITTEVISLIIQQLQEKHAGQDDKTFSLFDRLLSDCDLLPMFGFRWHGF
jgi:hypothetical protein